MKNVCFTKWKGNSAGGSSFSPWLQRRGAVFFECPFVITSCIEATPEQVDQLCFSVAAASRRVFFFFFFFFFSLLFPARGVKGCSGVH